MASAYISDAISNLIDQKWFDPGFGPDMLFHNGISNVISMRGSFCTTFTAWPVKKRLSKKYQWRRNHCVIFGRTLCLRKHKCKDGNRQNVSSVLFIYYCSHLVSHFSMLLIFLSLQVEVKPYVLDDQLCDECQGTRCGGKFAPFFCANVTCLQYYCEYCWAAIHSRAGREFHKPLVKEGGDRPRHISFRWNWPSTQDDWPSIHALFFFFSFLLHSFYFHFLFKV